MDTRALDQMEGDGQTLNGEMPENMDVEEKESDKLYSLIAEEGCTLFLYLATEIDSGRGGTC